jgi:DNA repair protein RadA/Sms
MTIILALLEKFAGVEIGMQDVFLSVAGGLRIDEPAADLAAAAAIASNHLNRQCLPDTLAIGELGLNGEVRTVSHLEHRIKEGLRMGFKRIIVPSCQKKFRVKDAEIIFVRKLEQALESIYG